MDRNNARTKAFETLHELNSVLIPRVLVDKTVSEEFSLTITKPIGKMDWPEKDKYARELITILKTSTSEEEILARADDALQRVIQAD